MGQKQPLKPILAQSSRTAAFDQKQPLGSPQITTLGCGRSGHGYICQFLQLVCKKNQNIANVIKEITIHTPTASANNLRTSVADSFGRPAQMKVTDIAPPITTASNIRILFALYRLITRCSVEHPPNDRFRLKRTPRKFSVN